MISTKLGYNPGLSCKLVFQIENFDLIPDRSLVKIPRGKLKTLPNHFVGETGLKTYFTNSKGDNLGRFIKTCCGKHKKKE